MSFSDSERARLEGRLEDGDSRMDRIESQLGQLVESQQRMSECLRKNTELTAGMGEVVAEMRELLELGRTGMRVLNWIGTAGYRIAKWVGTVAAAITAVYLAWHHVTHKGPPP